jgi:Ca2+-binding EF-hand superfamily protein
MNSRTFLGAVAGALLAGSVLAQTPAPTDQPHRPGDALLRADANKDGKVSFDELKTVRAEITQERFTAMDQNGDGFLGPEDRPKGKGGKAARGTADPEARRQMLQVLMAADANSDGKASFEEVTTAKPGFAKTDFDRADRNQDGFISNDDTPKAPQVTDRPKQPAAKAARGKGATPEQREAMRERIQKADTDGDGFVSREEARVGLPNVTDERFKTMDKDGDGKLGPGDRPAKPASPGSV